MVFLLDALLTACDSDLPKNVLDTLFFGSGIIQMTLLFIWSSICGAIIAIRNRVTVEMAGGAVYIFGFVLMNEIIGNYPDRGIEISSQDQEDGASIIPLKDQFLDEAVLFGVLVALYNNCLPLISVEYLKITRSSNHICQISNPSLP